MLVIVDHDQRASVTNDAEGVIADFVQRGLDVDGLRIGCRDTMGRWDGLATRNGRFAGFIALGKRTREAAIAEARTRTAWQPSSGQ